MIAGDAGEAELRTEIHKALAALGDTAMPAPTFGELTGPATNTDAGRSSEPDGRDDVIELWSRRGRTRLAAAGAVAAAAAIIAFVLLGRGGNGTELRTTPIEEREIFDDLPVAPSEDLIEEEGRAFLSDVDSDSSPSMGGSALRNGVNTIAGTDAGYGGLVFETTQTGDPVAGTRETTYEVFSRRSGDGLLWTTGTQPVSGLPDNASPIEVIHHGGRWFGLFQARHPSAQLSVFFETVLYVGWSPDLESWETAAIAPEPWEGGSSFLGYPDLAGLAVGDDRVVVTGLVSAELDLEAVFPDAGQGPFCDLTFENEAELRDCDGNVVQSVGEGDSTWDLLLEPRPEDERQAAIWSGPLTGPFQRTFADPSAGAVVDPRWSGERFVATVSDFDLDGTILESSDGTSWAPTGETSPRRSISVGDRRVPLGEISPRLDDPNVPFFISSGPGGAAIVVDDDTLFTSGDGQTWDRRRITDELPAGLLSNDPVDRQNTTVDVANPIVGATHVVMQVSVAVRDGDRVDIVERGWLRLPI